MKRAKVLIAAFLLACAFGCQPERNTVVPEQLRGVWKTTEPRYKDRFLAFTAYSIDFGTGGNTLDSFTIWNIERGSNGQADLYTITYVDSSLGRYKLAFHYVPGSGDEIRFKNQKRLTWRKERN